MQGGVETEVKLRVGSAAEARAALHKAGATLRTGRVFEDNVLLDRPTRPLTEAGCALRVRQVGSTGRLTFKGPRQVVAGLKSRPETEVAVSDPPALLAILQAVGFEAIFRYQKYRETWDLGDVEVVVDETPIGVFLEVEGTAEGIRQAVAALGFTEADHLTASYPDLFAATGRSGFMVFP